MKRMVSLLMVIALLAGCSAIAESAGVVTVQVWHPRGAGANGEMIASSVAKFNATIGADKGIQVVETYQGGYGDVLTASMNAITAGDSPEIVVVENSSGTPVLAQEGVLADLSSLAARDGWDESNVISGLLTYCVQDGKLIALPYTRSTPVMYYNKTMTDALGITLPMNDALSISDFEEAARKLTKVKDDGTTAVYGFSLQSNPWYTQNFLYQLGSNMYSNDGGSCPALEDGAMLKLLTTWRGWIDEGWCEPFVTTNDEAYLEEQFSQGNIAIILDSTGKMGNIFGAVAGMANPFEIGISFLPTFGNKPSAPTGGGNMAIIQKNNSDAEINAAWEFMKFLLTPEQDALNHVNTGYVPATNAAVDMDFVKKLWSEQPYRQVGFNQLAYAQDAPICDCAGEWANAFHSIISSLIQEKSITPEEAVEMLKNEAANIF